VYDEAALTRALALTGRQPFLLHQLGYVVISSYNRQRANLQPGVPPGTPLGVQAIEDAIPGILAHSNPAFASLWEWVLKIAHPQTHPQEESIALLHALAHEQPYETIGFAEQRQELLELFCERDLLYQEDQQHYRFRVPLFAYWIRAQRRLPRLGKEQS
jgi:hypothetical protein